MPSIPWVTSISASHSWGVRGFSSPKVAMFSFSWERLDIPERVTTTSGRDWRNRKAQEEAVSPGRRAVRGAASSGVIRASWPPRRGSITQTGMFHSRSSSTFALPSWKVQSR